MGSNRLLITGVTGFVGSHLTEHIQEQQLDYEVFGTSYGTNLNTVGLDANHLFSLNLLDSQAIQAVVDQVKPTHVIHLAALSSPALSFQQPKKTIEDNVGMQINLFEALLKLDVLPTTLVISSAEVYGNVQDEHLPANENTPIMPRSPYAVSKITQEYLGIQYFLSHKLPVIRLRPFNHTGERRPEIFVIPAFAAQIARIEAGLQEPVLKTGNLLSSRDFTDVKDIVRAYMLAFEKCEPGDVYNIGSGKEMVIKDVLEMLLNLSEKSIRVESENKTDGANRLVANFERFFKTTGWQPTIPLENTILRVLNYWRQEVTKTSQLAN